MLSYWSKGTGWERITTNCRSGGHPGLHLFSCEFTDRLDTAAAAEMKCEPCFRPLARASADGADPLRPGSSRPAENTSTPTAPAPRGQPAPPDRQQRRPGQLRWLQPRADPVRPGPSGRDMIYFGRNRAIEICEQKAEPWSWAEQQTVTDTPPPNIRSRSKGAPGFPQPFSAARSLMVWTRSYQAGFPPLPEPFPALAVSTSRGAGFGGRRGG